MDVGIVGINGQVQNYPPVVMIMQIKTLKCGDKIKGGKNG